MKEKIDMTIAVENENNDYELNVVFKRTDEIDYVVQLIFKFETFEELTNQLNNYFMLEKNKLFSELFGDIDNNYELADFDYFIDKNLYADEFFELIIKCSNYTN